MRVLYLIHSWKDSLQVFSPKSFKLFFLVTLKNIMQSYKYLAYYFGWLFLLTAAVDYGYAHCFAQPSFVCLVPLVLWFVLFFIIYLTIRSSIKRKSWEYYFDYRWYFIAFLALSFVGFVLADMVVRLGIYALYVAATLSYVAGSLAWIVQAVVYLLVLPLLLLTILISFLVAPEHLLIYVSPLITFNILFLLDAKPTIGNFFKSFIRACRMIVYNYPFCFITFIIFLLSSFVMRKIIMLLGGPASFLLMPIIPVLLLPIPLCFLNSFYIKRVHDQFTVYFPETVKE